MSSLINMRPAKVFSAFRSTGMYNLQSSSDVVEVIVNKVVVLQNVAYSDLEAAKTRTERPCHFANRALYVCQGRIIQICTND